MDLRKCMAFKAVNQLNLIEEMKSLKKPNCNIGMQEHLTILKIYMIKTPHLKTIIWVYMGPSGTKILYNDFSSAPMISLMGERVRSFNYL